MPPSPCPSPPPLLPLASGKRPLGALDLETVQAAVESNRHWLEDCLILLLCVLALDRFGDYGSDQVCACVWVWVWAMAPIGLHSSTFALDPPPFVLGSTWPSFTLNPFSPSSLLASPLRLPPHPPGHSARP
jgi:hypothetical protein